MRAPPAGRTVFPLVSSPLPSSLSSTHFLIPVPSPMEMLMFFLAKSTSVFRRDFHARVFSPFVFSK